jgi:hypothetical protein
MEMRMKIYISRFDLNDLNPDFEFFQVEVSFYDDKSTPQPGADVRVFLKKDKTKTIEAIKRDAIQEAVKYLKSVLADRSA